jgi:hypothetical protein
MRSNLIGARLGYPFWWPKRVTGGHWDELNQCSVIFASGRQRVDGLGEGRLVTGRRVALIATHNLPLNQ